MEDLHWGPHLKNIIMVDSGLRGSIGHGIFDNATALEDLKLTTETPLMKANSHSWTHSAGLSGTIPDELFAHATQLRNINIAHNDRLSGTMPLSIESLSSLGILLLHNMVLEPQ